MDTYKIRMKVEIVPCTESPSPEPIQQDDGSVEMIIPESEAISIDRCERNLLQTAYPTLRDTLSKHLSDLSKKNALTQGQDGTVVENRRTYWVDGEIGRCEFRTHQVLKAGKTVYNTALDAFPRKKCWEWYKTSGFKEIAFIYGASEESYRKTSRLINRLRYQSEEGTTSRTVREQAEGE